MPDVLGAVERLAVHLVHVDQLRRLFLRRAARAPRAPSTLALLACGLPARHVLEHVLQVDAHLLHALRREKICEHRRRAARARSTSTCGRRACRRASWARSFSRVAARSARRRRWRRCRRGRARGWRAAAGRAAAPRRASRRAARDLRRLLVAHQRDGGLDQVADHRLDVAADVADLGELGRLDLDERRLRQLRQAARDLGLADAGGADHDDVLRRDLVAQLARRPAAAASGCAARSPPRAWRRAGRRCSGRARATISRGVSRRGPAGVTAQSSSKVRLRRWCRCRCRRRSAATSRRSARAASCVCCEQRARGGQRVGAARADRRDAVVGLDHVAGAARG